MDKMRLDKWLWVARFYKTRALATEAVNGGKVHLKGERCKPGRLLAVNDGLKIRQGPYEFVLVVLSFAKHRGPAKMAQLMYKESDESIQLRQQRQEQLKTVALYSPKMKNKPNKQERRKLINIKKLN